MNFNNPYYIKETNMSVEQELYMKENNIYFINIITCLIKYHGIANNITSNYKKRILSGELYNSDKKTGINTNSLGEKIKAFIILLDKEDNRNKFFNSYFYTAMTRIATGNTNIDNYNEEWLNYTKTSFCDEELQQCSPLTAALVCYRADKTVPLGLNISRLMDNIVQKDQDGNYQIIDTTAEQGDLMYQAVCEQVIALKKISKFQHCFENKKLK